MAKCSLRFYEKSKLKPDKNWCFDDIETYLSTLTYFDVSDFQYQRFEIDKEIRVDFSQSEQTISSSAKKYDYLRISTIVNNAPIYYYYFIVKTRQVSESTIAYQLRMDTLNTFKFDSTSGNNKYTLSTKTLVKREHKDRINKNKSASTFYKSSTDWDTFVNNLINDLGASAPETGFLSIFWSTLHSYCQGLSSGNKNPIITGTETDVLVKSGGGGFTTYKVDEIRFNCNSSSYIRIMLYKNNVMIQDFYLSSGNNTALFVKVNYHEDYPLKTLTWGTTGNTIGVLFGYILNPYSVYLLKTYYERIIDEYQEGLSTILFKKSENQLLDNDEINQWYVVYASANAVTSGASDTAAIYVNPVQVRFYSDKGYSLTTTAAHEVALYASSPLIPKYNNMAERVGYDMAFSDPAPLAGEKYIKIAWTTYDFHDYFSIYVRRKNNNDFTFDRIELLDRSNVSSTISGSYESIIFYGIDNAEVFSENNAFQDSYQDIIPINSGASTYSGTSSPWQDVDLTDSRLIKAFAFPYAPCEFLVGNDSFKSLPDGIVWTTDGCMEMSIQQTKLFNYQKLFNVINPQFNSLLDINFTIAAGQARNIKMESKLYHSDYYQPKVVYDSFSFPFYLEDLDVDEYIKDPLFENLLMGYVISQNIQSKFMFTFPQYVLKRSRQDYDNILTIERNNEKALFNSAYINYVRSGGYSYDTKKASSQNAINGVTTALSIVGSVASFAGGVASGNPMLAVAGIGLGVGAATGIIRSVHTAQEQDRAISQKIMQAHAQGTSVQGSEDIDILTAFSGNKAKIVYYELSDIMKQAMWDLFHYCGYATHEQKIPNVSTRLYFNFVQAEIIFESYNFNEEIADDIQNKWNEGVTFFHAVSGAYDINQEYENFETSLM